MDKETRDVIFGDLESFEDGLFDIQFVGEDRPRRGIQIDYAVRDGYGGVHYLVSPDGTIWNWSTIIRVKRITTKEKANNG